MTDTGGRNNEELGNEVETADTAASSAKTPPAPAPSQGDVSETPSSEASEGPVLTGCASVGLASLAPKFEPDQHDTYLRRLSAAVEDDKNRNIALTGRYGAGKSSVLDEFEKATGESTLRLAIPSLGPNEEGATLTNRIQKELVKQLVYSAAPTTLRHSRFTRSIALSRRRAAAEAAVFVLVVGGFLAMLGWLPPAAGTGPDHHILVRLLGWLVLGGLLVIMATVVRLVTHDRYQVAEVSAGGATISLSKPEHTYFDEYLDDIVNYFDNEAVDIVIFEDLDRFDDPHIFEALRELNTLLNKTKKRQGKTPLRFVYAVRDSLFELIGNDTATNSGDAAQGGQGDTQDPGQAGPRTGIPNESDDRATAEAIRANRTKFFDVVIPMVPFISHRNARELLVDLLNEAGVDDIQRPLVSVVARYATDMRLLRNMRNEYLVFAERLLESDKVAPGLTASNLFALVAYKNFHMADFEDIARQASVLDRLYDYRRELVRSNIERLEREKRAVASDRKRERARAPLAARLSGRLQVATNIAHAQSGQRGWPHLTWQVGNQKFTVKDLNGYRFWAAVADAASVQALAGPSPDSGGTPIHTFGEEGLKRLVPEAFDAGRWADIDARQVASELADIDRSIAFLRGSNFDDLAGVPDFALSLLRGGDGSFRLPPGPNDPAPDPGGEPVELTFRQLVVETMPSKLGRELVLRGYLERNFALYAAQFYGHFTGVDVANFVVQNVQTNTMEVDYQFDGPESVDNLLDEADDDFIHTVAAYNIDVLNYLLDKEDPRAATIVHHVADDPDNPDAKTFFTAYLTSSTARREKFVGHLAAKPWRDVFEHLAAKPDIPDDARPNLFSAALCSAKEHKNYALSTTVADYITEHYLEMPVFTDQNTGGSAAAVAGVLAGAGVQLPTINTLHDNLLALVVAERLYAVTADTLHVAVGDPQAPDTSGDHDAVAADLSLDRLRDHEDVYRHLLTSPDDYLDAVDDDPQTRTTVRTAETLAAVLGDIDAADAWEDEQVRRLIDRSSPNSRLDDLTTVPRSTWIALAAAGRFRATLRNVEAYRDEVGTIDEHLGRLLEVAGQIDANDGPDSTDADGNEIDKVAATYAVLNTSEIAVAADRVKLAVSIGAPKPLSVAEIDADEGHFLALLLSEGLVADDEETFRHFHGSGWTAIGPGIETSTNFPEFITPALVDGIVADVLRDKAASGKVGRHIVENAATFVPDSDTDALLAAGRYAHEAGIALPVETIRRVATAADAENDRRVVLELLRGASPAASPENVVEVFAALGSPYNQVTQPGETFYLVKDDLHAELLTRLGDRIEFRKRAGRESYKVTVR